MKYKLIFLSCLIVTFVDMAHGRNISMTSSHFIKDYSPKDYQDARDLGMTTCPCTIGESPDEELLPYFERLKQAIRKDDRKFIAEELISYPFIWHQDDTNTNFSIIGKRKEFLQHYDAIMTPSIKEYILGIEYETERCICYIYVRHWEIGDGCLSLDEEGLSSISEPHIKKRKR